VNRKCGEETMLASRRSFGGISDECNKVSQPSKVLQELLGEATQREKLDKELNKIWQHCIMEIKLTREVSIHLIYRQRR